jgi:hypothetical protein
MLLNPIAVSPMPCLLIKPAGALLMADLKCTTNCALPSASFHTFLLRRWIAAKGKVISAITDAARDNQWHYGVSPHWAAQHDQ